MNNTEENNEYSFANSTRNSALLWHERPHPAPKKSRGKICSIALAAAAFIVLVAVLSIAGLALYMGALRSEPTNSLISYTCSVKVARGDRFLVGLQEKARKYRLQFEALYQRSSLGPSVVSCIVEKFGNDTLTIYFKVTLNRRKIPRHIHNVEKSLRDILASDAINRKPIFRNVRFDARSIAIKQITDSEQYQRVITKPKELPNPRPGSVLLKPTLKTNLTLTADLPIKKKLPIEEIDIKEDDLPVIQGSFKISKTDADITEKKAEINAQLKTTTSTSTSIPKRPIIKETSVTSALFKLASSDRTTPMPVQTTRSTEASTTVIISTVPAFKYLSTIPSTTPKIALANPDLFSVSPNIFNQEPWVPIFRDNDDSSIDVTLSPVNIFAGINNNPVGNPTFNQNYPINKHIAYNPSSEKPVIDEQFINNNNNNKSFKEPIIVENIDTKEVVIINPTINEEDVISTISNENYLSKEQVVYTSFTNPGLSFHSLDAEKLGSTSLQGHPIPVNKITEVTEPSVWDTTSITDSITDIYITTEETIENREEGPELYDLNTSDNNYDEASSFVEVETLKYVPGSASPFLNDAVPTLSKWEFIHGTNVTKIENAVDKMLNETLQANVSAEQSNYKLKQSTIHKNISSIFHSLASSLGIAPIHFTNINRNGTDKPIERVDENEKPVVLQPEIIVGQGQAEVVEADDVSLILQTETTKLPLVTLLPVKSNSGVGRPLRPRPKDNDTFAENRSFPNNSPKNNLNLNNYDTNKIKYVETEVVTSVSSELNRVKMNKNQLSDFKIVSILNFETEAPNLRISTTGNSVKDVSERNPKMDLVETTTEYRLNITIPDVPIYQDDVAILTMNLSTPSQKEDTVQYLTPEKLKQLSEISKLSNNSTIDDTGVISTKAVSSSSSYTVNHSGFKILTKTFNKIPNSLKEAEKQTSPGFNSFYFSVTNKSECSNFTIKCGDGQCLPDTARCNQLVDCNDGSDEKDCNCADFLRSQFLLRKICDGIVDCWDFSDENHCEWCKPGQYVCGNSKICINRTSICDGVRDCPHGDDERQCVTVAPTLSAADEFPYHSEGYLMVRKHGKWGKLCVQNFENVVSKSQTAWEISDLGQAVCKAMTYQSLDNVKILIENKFKSIYRNSNYFELSYSFQNETRSSLSFENTTCTSGEVVRVKCQALECGARPQASKQIARIVGGANAGLGAWPWQAALYKEGEFQCGATLISDKWLLSAGHCFYHSLEEHWVARLGALRRGTALPSPYEQLRPIVKIVLHPGYIDAGFINDVSLLKMEVPVIFSDYVRPICLPPPGVAPRDGRMCTVVGWGQLFEVGRIFPDTLQEVQVPVISTAECRKRTVFLPLYKVTDDMFCAGYERGGRDACLGDSGGPLMCPEPDGRWVLHGITSNGYGCARAYRPGVYTKVSNYVTWINSYVFNTKNESVVPVKDACIGHRCPLGECLPKSRLCNGFIECSDGSDEVGCLSKN